MSRRVFAITIACLMCLASLAGCTTSTTTTAATGATTTKATTTAATTSSDSGYEMSDVENMTARGVLPIVVEPMSMKLALQTKPNVTDYADNHLTQHLEEMTGIEIVFEFLPAAADEATTKIDLTIAAGENLPDIVYGLVMDRSKIQQYGQGGYFADLTDFYDEYAYFFDLHFEGASDDYMTYLSNVISSEGGKIYTMPAVDFALTGAWRHEYLLYKPWLDALGLELPSTTDELYEVLTAFKTGDPNGNGMADEIPMIWSQNQSYSGGSRNLLNAFEYMSSTGLLVAADGSLQMCATTENYREGLRYIHKLVSEGLISPLTYTITRPELKTMIALADSETTYVGGFIDAPILAIGSDNSRYVEYTSIESRLAGPEGKAYTTFYPYSANPANFIAADSDIKEIAFRFLDYMYEQDTSIITRYGVEDVHWEKVDPETSELRYPTGTKPYWALISNFWGQSQNFNWNTHIAMGPPVNWTPAKVYPADPNNLTPTEYRNEDSDIRIQANLAPGATPDKIVLPLIYTMDESSEISETLTILNTFIAESEAKFALGELSLDNDWDYYLNELKIIGIDRYLEVATAAYNRMN